MMQKEIQVYAHWQGIENPFLMGILKSNILRSKEIFSFEYSKEWLNSEYAQQIDPDLQLYSGNQFTINGKSNFGVFLDSSPDRWGRLLMRRRESVLARIENRKENFLHESDYLLGVFDEYRMGALRFKVAENAAFLNDNKEMASPPWVKIRDLEYASLQLEKEDNYTDNESLKWLNMLITPGSSLGGARPKASITDENNDLWIAKFPSGNDDKDIGAWELIVNILAKDAGIHTAVSKIEKLTDKNHTFFSKRFDRTPSGERIHFSSAMTLLGYTDGVDFHDGISYLELLEFIIKNGASINKDLEELWTRIVFYICVSNTDDHLRNHGFLLTNKGWVLSPAYDMNPQEDGNGLKLNISENDNSLSIDLALSVASLFRINHHKASEIINKVIKSVNNWKYLAKKFGISNSEQERMSNAFRLKK